MAVVYPERFSIQHVVRVQCEVRTVLEVDFSLVKGREPAESHVSVTSVVSDIDIILYVVAFHFVGKVGHNLLWVSRVEFLQADDVRVFVLQKSNYRVCAFFSGEFFTGLRQAEAPYIVRDDSDAVCRIDLGVFFFRELVEVAGHDECRQQGGDRNEGCVGPSEECPAQQEHVSDQQKWIQQAEYGHEPGACRIYEIGE